MEVVLRGIYRFCGTVLSSFKVPQVYDDLIGQTAELCFYLSSTQRCVKADMHSSWETADDELHIGKNESPYGFTVGLCTAMYNLVVDSHRTNKI